METERLLDVSVEDMRNIFGKQDHHIRKLEEDLHVKIVDRNGAVRIMQLLWEWKRRNRY